MAMDLVRWVLFLSYILTTLSGYLTNAQPLFTAIHCYSDTSTNDDTFNKNLDTLAPLISSSTVSFLNLSIGENPDSVNVIALCRGDVALDICRSCLNDAYTMLRDKCPNGKQSVAWFDDCMLRYSDRSIFNTMFTSPSVNTSNPAIVSNGITRQFNQAVTTLLSELLGKASTGTYKKVATGNIAIGADNNRRTIYALAECTPDLSVQKCRECLNHTHEVLPQCCDGRTGGRVLYPSCNFRYDIYPFYSTTTSDGGSPTTDATTVPPTTDATTVPPTTDATTVPSPSVQGTRNLIIIAAVIFLVLVIVCIWIIMRKRKKKLLNENEGETSMESFRVDFSDIIKVDFSDTNKLRQDVFGAVYKGRLPKGQDVAVKRLSQTSHQGDIEFKNVWVSAAKMQHKNLVRLRGFSLQGTERLLIYEFIANASLDQFIFENREYLDWHKRYDILEGIARGLAYLHEESRVPTIHGDLKASNILFDDEMNPKIADFSITPESGQFSTKSDVFSFGVLVLEIISSQKNSPNREECLPRRAWKHRQEGTDSEFIDPTLRDGSSPINEILECLQIGLRCVQEKEDDRPTMATVVTMLNNLSLPIQKPTEPTLSS